MDKKSNTYKLCFSSVMCAISLVILLTGILPATIYVSIYISISTLVVIKDMLGTKYWAMSYIAVSIVSLILIPNLEVSLTCVCMGWYPLLIDTSNKLKEKHKYLALSIKYIIVMLASYLIYKISIFVFGSDELVDNIPFFFILYMIMFTLLFLGLEGIIWLFRRTIIRRLKRVNQGMS